MIFELSFGSTHQWGRQVCGTLVRLQDLRYSAPARLGSTSNRYLLRFQEGSTGYRKGAVVIVGNLLLAAARLVPGTLHEPDNLPGQLGQHLLRQQLLVPPGEGPVHKLVELHELHNVALCNGGANLEKFVV